jgi:acetyl esterase/lipase
VHPEQSLRTLRTLAIALLACAAVLGLLGPAARAGDAPVYPLRMDRYDPSLPVPGTAVMVIHGGGWWSGSPDNVEGICEAVTADLGMTCFAPDYTLSGTAPYPAANLDLTAAVGYIRSLGFSRLGVIGLSAGGNLAAWLASRRLVDVAAVWSAPADLRTLPDWNPPDHPGKVGVIRSFAPTPNDRRAASPALRQIAIPLLVVNSEDELIPLSQARELYRDATGTRRLTVIPGHGHAAEYTARELPETLNWFASYL